MTTRQFSVWISDQLRRAIKVGLPIAAALSFCVGTNGCGNESLFGAIRSGQVRKARAALSQGIDANSTTASGQTPLILAASLGRVQIVHLLLDHHASVNAKDENGATALMVASTSGHLAVVRELLKRGADVNLTNQAGMTPVLAAIMSDQFGVAEYLVTAGANVNSAAANGATPLIGGYRGRANELGCPSSEAWRGSGSSRQERTYPVDNRRCPKPVRDREAPISGRG